MSFIIVSFVFSQKESLQKKIKKIIAGLNRTITLDCKWLLPE